MKTSLWNIFKNTKATALTQPILESPKFYKHHEKYLP